MPTSGTVNNGAGAASLPASTVTDKMNTHRTSACSITCTPTEFRQWCTRIERKARDDHGIIFQLDDKNDSFFKVDRIAFKWRSLGKRLDDLTPATIASRVQLNADGTFSASQQRLMMKAKQFCVALAEAKATGKPIELYCVWTPALRKSRNGKPPSSAVMIWVRLRQMIESALKRSFLALSAREQNDVASRSRGTAWAMRHMFVIDGVKYKIIGMSNNPFDPLEMNPNCDNEEATRTRFGGWDQWVGSALTVEERNNTQVTFTIIPEGENGSQPGGASTASSSSSPSSSSSSSSSPTLPLSSSPKEQSGTAAAVRDAASRAAKASRMEITSAVLNRSSAQASSSTSSASHGIPTSTSLSPVILAHSRYVDYDFYRLSSDQQPSKRKKTALKNTDGRR